MRTFNLRKSVCRAAGILLAVIWSAISTPAADFAGSRDPEFNTPGITIGLAEALLVQPDGRILVAGNFNQFADLPRSGIARLLPDGSVDASFAPTTPEDQSIVMAVALDSEQRILATGPFQHFGGQPLKTLARLSLDGTIDSAFFSGLEITGSPTALAVLPDSKIILSGFSLGAGGIVRLASDGRFDPGFSVSSTSLPFVSTSAIQPDGKIIYVTGTPGSDVPWFGRLHPDGSLDESFRRRGRPVFTGDAGTAIHLLPDGRILLAGGFTLDSIEEGSPSVISKLARFHSDGTLDPSFRPITWEPPSAALSAMVVQPDGKIVVAGSFTNAAGTGWNQIARFDSDGRPDLSFDPGSGPIGTLQVLALDQQSRILAAGPLNSYDGAPANFVIRLRADQDGPVPPEILGSGSEINASAGQQFAFYFRVRGLPSPSLQWTRNGAPLPATENILRLGPISEADAGTYILVASNAAGVASSPPITVNFGAASAGPGSVDASFRIAALAGPVSPVAAARSDGQVFIASRNENGTGSTLRLFNQSGELQRETPLSRDVEKSMLPLPDGKLLASTRQGFLRLHSDGSPDSSFVSSLSARAAAHSVLLDHSGRIIAGFTNRGIRATATLQRFFSDGTPDSEFGATLLPTAIGAVEILPDRRLLVGSASYIFGPQLVRLLENGSTDPEFTAAIQSGIHTAIYSMKLQRDGRILVGGVVSTTGAEPRWGIFRLLPDGAVDESFRVRFASGTESVHEIFLLDDHTILIGGNFTTIEGHSRRNLARLFNDGRLDTSFNTGFGPNGLVDQIVPLGHDSLLITGAFTEVDGHSLPGVARLRIEPRFQIELGAATTQEFRISVFGPAGKMLILERTEALPAAAWEPLSQTPGAGKVEVFSIPFDAPDQSFYRVRME